MKLDNETINRIHKYHSAVDHLNTRYALHMIAESFSISCESVKFIGRGGELQKLSRRCNIKVRHYYQLYLDLQKLKSANAPKQIAYEMNRHVQTVYKWFWKHYPTEMKTLKDLNLIDS